MNPNIILSSHPLTLFTPFPEFSVFKLPIKNVSPIETVPGFLTNGWEAE
jgi:hypothetical protein